MSYDETLATPREKRAVLFLATMYDGGRRSVSCEEVSAAIGAQGDEFENLILRMSEANLIRYRNVEGFSLTAMVVDAAERINRSPSLDMADSVQKIAARSKAILLAFLLFAGVCGLLLFAARQIFFDQRPPLRAGVQQP